MTMAEAQLGGLQDEFTCLVCLYTLNDPVTIPCGHNFCLKCLTDCWDQSQECSCPQCRHTFTTRPELNRNTQLNEVIKRYKRPRLSPPLSQNYAGPGDVECDFCTGKKFRAVKSCLTCMASYCQTHLQPHYEVAALKHHKLVDPDRNLKEKFCGKYQKSLEMFCRTDKTFICLMCAVNEHNSHEKSALETEREGKKKQLVETQSEIRKRLEDKEKKLKKTRSTVEEMKVSVKQKMEEHDKSFTALIQCIEEAHKKLTEKIREQEKRNIEKAEGVMEQLEKEIEELKRKDVELKKLSETKDHVHFLQTFSSCCVLPADGDSLSFTVKADFSSEGLLKEMSDLKKSLEKISQWEILTWTPPGCEASFFTLRLPEPQSREEFLQYFCPLTLDINTAHRDLRLSEGNKKVTCEMTKTKYPDHPDRFDCCVQVLCREALTGTRCYWEVEFSGDFMMIGVAYKGLSRKGDGEECILGINDKSWNLVWSHSQYSVCHNNNQTAISAPYSPRIGVYLDWPAGSLSFYSISHTMTLLHRFNTSFTEPLYPGFCFGLHCSVTISHLTPCDH
ncbi:tripartite motif-containing protein 16-like isoform X2 [Erpetoichthys calabaricus]|uniref:tripartite motif-containing protein 16-like isoform X2 n=1 Tax=Erpetoichthys calabaricus TaxID=27687 RepID=UPI0022348250|nr:tripartite motif-containing protein 16-like isoform X2 [Erpetoichthys calabaricus]XP_051783835.1 tripartite motif-containing protein 16-like isoform X2 [Erpetoichthys calabaricus]